MQIPNSNPEQSNAPTIHTVTQAAQHLGYLDGLRALAAIFVVLDHSLFQVNAEKLPSKVPAFLQIFYYGRYSVDWFIVLSGFCLMLPIVRGNGKLRGGSIDFFLRRAKRILPPYYASMTLSLLLIWGFIGEKTGTHWDVTLPVTTKSIVTHLLLIHDAFGESATINHVFWSIAVEWRIYFLFPLLLLSWHRLGPWITVTGSVLGSLVLCRVLTRFFHSDLTAYYIGLFAFGMLGCAIAFSTEDVFVNLRRLPWAVLATISAFAVIGLSLFSETLNPIPYLLYIFRDIMVGIWATTVLVWVTKSDNWGHKFLSFPPLVWVGTFAYSIYLIHAPLLQLLWQYPLARLQGTPVAMFTALAFLGTPLILLASYGFFLLCERPFLRKRPLARPEALVVKTTLDPAP